MTHFDVYGRMADAGVLEVHQNGRYLAQKEGEKFVPADVMPKLRINKDDSFSISVAVWVSICSRLPR